MGDPGGFPFVVKSDISIESDGGPEVLEAAFQDRIGLVERWPGFGRLEVWRDVADSTKFVMVSWWASKEHFAAYMRSGDHRESHDRIPGNPHRPQAQKVTRYKVVAR